MSLQNINPTEPINLEKLVTPLLTDTYEAVRRACLRYQGSVRQDELDDLSQQVILELIEDNCQRLRSFNCQSSFKTWLQAVVNHHAYKYFYRRKQSENLNEVNHVSLTYSPAQDRDIYFAEKQVLLSRALGTLSEEERLLYQLCFVFEQDANRVAAIVGIDVKNVYKRKHVLVLKLTRLVQIFQCH